MPEPYEETEAKFYVRDLDIIRQRILASGGLSSSPRTLEFNLRFDTAAGELQRTGRVLRLRRDQASRLTYKEDRRLRHGATTRTEIEFGVGDFEAARHFLAALGYGVIFAYEKYREIFVLGEVDVMLDELPFGSFVEIEGPLARLVPAAKQAKLEWSLAIPVSYQALFEELRGKRGLLFRDLTFENFKGIAVHPADLGLQPAG